MIYSSLKLGQSNLKSHVFWCQREIKKLKQITPNCRQWLHMAAADLLVQLDKSGDGQVRRGSRRSIVFVVIKVGGAQRPACVLRTLHTH